MFGLFQDVVARRRERIETYTEPIRCQSPEEMAEIRSFLSEFYRTIYQRRLELDELLEEYPDSVGKYYEYLVIDTQRVAHEDFWQRYLYKCDEKRRHSFFKQQQQHPPRDDFWGRVGDLKEPPIIITKEEETVTTCSISTIDSEDDGATVVRMSDIEEEDEDDFDDNDSVDEGRIISSDYDDYDDDTIALLFDSEELEEDEEEEEEEDDDEEDDDEDNVHDTVSTFTSTEFDEGEDEGKHIGIDDDDVVTLLQALGRGYLSRRQIATKGEDTGEK